MKEVWFPAGTQFRALAPLRADIAGMSDHFPAKGRNINACLAGLNAELFATFRNDDTIEIDTGKFGMAKMRLPEIYASDFGPKDPMVFKAIKMYSGHRLRTGVSVHIDCQYGAGGLSTSSSVAAAIHAFLSKIFGLPYDPWKMVWDVIRTEPHCYGRQDQLAVVFGGINMWEMSPEKFDFSTMTPLSFHRCNRYPLEMCPESEKALEESILLYESGINVGADQILHSVAEGFQTDAKRAQKKFDRINDIASELWVVLSSHIPTSAEMAERLGLCFNKVRDAHASLHPDVLNQRINDLFEVGLANGASGCRPTGAGGRGVMMFAVPAHRRASLEDALDNVDTPKTGSNTPMKGRIQHFDGFDQFGARCWSAKF